MRHPDRVELVEVTDSSTVLNSVLRERVQRSSTGCMTEKFVAYEQGNEAAFLSVDLRTDLDLLVIYEIFVPRDLQNRGIGTRVLLAAEELGRDHGLPRARLVPKSISESDDDERERKTAKLIAWYESHGYQATEDSNFREWQKEL